MATKMFEFAPPKREMPFCNVNCNVPMDKVRRIRTGRILMQAIHIQRCGNFLSWVFDGPTCIEMSEYTRRYSTYFRRSMRLHVSKK